jgi:hypothetical protein
MPINVGSSPYYISGLTFSAQRGNQGPDGPRGLTGPTGNPGYGPTGPTGPGITFINFINNIVNTIYTDGRVRSSNNIERQLGNYYIDITGTTSGNFSPLASTGFTYNIEKQVQGEILTFPVVRQLKFKNLSTNTSDFIKFEYTRPDTNPSGGPEPGQTIKISYNVFNLSIAGISGGPVNSLLYNAPGNFQYGLTGTTHSASNSVSNFGILNAAEQLAVISPQKFDSNKVNVWKLDPTEASVFYLTGFSTIALTSTTHVYGNHICIKKDTTTNSTKGFTIILPKEFYASNEINRIFYSTYDEDSDIIASNFTLTNFKNTFEPNIIWQSDSYFCPSNNKYDVINFISIGSRYVGIPVQYDSVTNTRPTELSSIPETFICKPTNVENFYRATFNPVYGLCCNTDCTCNPGYNFECSGYFYEGVTCGGATGICTNLGACCLYSEQNNIVVPCQELRFCDCYKIANESNFSYKWSPFTKIKKTCADFNCFNAKNNIGACCDGNGVCVEVAESSCQHFYQGDGVNCTTSENLNVCTSGYGACCDSGITCSPGITGETCLSEFKSYFGDGTTCGDFVCSASDLPCYSIIQNQLLAPGTEYDDAIVVGIFNPKNTKVLGAKLFDGSVKGFTALSGTTLDNVNEYLTAYDYSGYGFDQTTTCDDESDSYLLLVSKHPISLDASKNVYDGNAYTNKFIWSNNSVAWGPLVNIGANVVDEFTVNNLSYKEGYVYSTINQESSKLSLYENSFLTCSSARFDTNSSTHLENRPIQSFIGNWTRNYGLYNTIRMVSGEYFYYNIGSSQSGATLSNYTPTTTNITAARALSVYNLEKPSSESYISSWYIPSIDELGFIASACSSTTEFNLNARLIESGYTPLDGYHWSSTGALNTSNNEGILTPAGVTHGTEAWVIKFDIDGNVDNMEVSRKTRSTEYFVRPVKMIRCDKQFYSINENNFKLWYVPILSETIIDNS